MDFIPQPVIHGDGTDKSVFAIGFKQQIAIWYSGAAASCFPRGEAVAQIGTSEPIWVTDEERRNGLTLYAVRKKGTI